MVINTAMSQKTAITYLLDPLCGWCYGAAPVLHRLKEVDGIDVELAPTGLFSGAGARPMDASFAAYAWSNDQRIERQTGQRFTKNYQDKVLGKHGQMFDSGPATLALTAVLLSEPARELDALKAIQEARYIDGRDTTDAVVLQDILATLNLHEAAAQVAKPGASLLAANQARMVKARGEMQAFGANGVPTLIVSDGSGKRRMVDSSFLYGSFDKLLAHLKAA
jgi:putative protein-disulfide isomerase